MRSWLLDANNFRLVKIVKYNFNISGKITGLTVLSLCALGMDSMRLLVHSLISLPSYCSKADGLTALDFFLQEIDTEWTCRKQQSQNTASSLLLASGELVLMQDQNEVAFSSAWVTWNKYSAILSEWLLPFALHPNWIKKPHHQLGRICLQSQSKQGTKRGLFNGSI